MSNGKILFDRKKLRVQRLQARVHDLTVGSVLPLEPRSVDSMAIPKVAKKITSTRKFGRSVILMAGGHVLRSGVQNYLIDLMESGYISCIAMNGSGMIHDYEFALIGATTESVSKYIKKGEFGLWKETGYLNDIINSAYKKNRRIGMGEAVGKAISKGKYPYKSISILSAAYRLGIPVTIHVGVGYDIIHEHPNCDGAATGALSYNDFLKFASVVQNLEGGVVMNFGSAVMGPEVYLKALSMARNVARRSRKSISKFTTLVCDLHNLKGNFKVEPSKDSPEYYFRPWKTMLTRTVSDGGESFYVRGRHSDTIPSLWTALEKLSDYPKSRDGQR